jgi:hypothetical protein
MIKQSSKENDMKTAHETYNERREEMMTKLEKLYALLEATDMRESANKNSWGFAGGLGHVNEELDNLIKFMAVTTI